MNRMRDRILEIGILLTIAMLPLQWVSLATVAGLNLRLFHLASGITLLGLLLHTQIRRVGPYVVPAALVVLIPYAVLLTWATAGTLWSPFGIGAVLPIVFKATVYAALFLIYALGFGVLEPARLKRVTVVGGGLGLAGFLMIASLIFVALGRNFVLEYVRAFVTGQAGELQWGFYPVLFNFSVGDPWGGGADRVGSSLRNTLVGGFVLLFLLSRAVDTRRDGAGSGGVSRVTGRAVLWSISVLSAAFVVMSVSRSNMIVLLGSIGIALALGLPSVRTPGVVKGWTAMIGLATVATLAPVWWDPVVGGLGVVAERLVELAANPRFEMYEVALREIEGAPFLGDGLGAKVAYLSYEQRVHNVVLASWYELGLLGASLALIWYLTTASLWLILAFNNRPGTGRWLNRELRWHWVCALPLLPMFRSLVSGDGGQFTFIEWVCLAAFVGLMGRNSHMLWSRGTPVGETHGA